MTETEAARIAKAAKPCPFCLRTLVVHVDRFGNAVALNDDGNTLAVGAQGEDGGTTGIGSVPNDSAADAGAVYLY